MPKLKAGASKKTKVTRVHREMSKFKRGTLHSGSKKGPIVKSRSQAVAIALSEAGLSKKKRGGKAKTSKRALPFGKTKRAKKAEE